MGDNRQYYSDYIDFTHPATNGKVVKNHKKPESSDTPRSHINQPETYFVLSSVVTVCFNCPLGMIALFCSWDAKRAFDRGDMKIGRGRAKWAFFLSMFSMVLTVGVVMAVVFYVAYLEAGK